MGDQKQLLGMSSIDNCIVHFVNHVVNRSKLERDDVEQELRLQAFISAQTFDPKEKQSTFVTYLWEALRWRSSNMLRGWYRYENLRRSFKQAMPMSANPLASPTISPELLLDALKQKIKDQSAIKVIDLLEKSPQEIYGPMDPSPLMDDACIEPQRVAAYLGVSDVHLRKSVAKIRKAIWEVLHDHQEE